jgi:hypothetical protein
MTSAKRNMYFAGRVRQASVVMMRDLHAKGYDPMRQVFVSESRQAPATSALAQRSGIGGGFPAEPSAARNSAPRAKSVLPVGQLDHDVGDTGR